MRLSNLAKSLKSGQRDDFAKRIWRLEKEGKKILHLDIGDPDFDTPKHIIEAAVKSLRSGDTHYDVAGGTRDFRKAIAKSVKKELGFLPEEEQILIGPSPMLIYFLLQCVADKGDEVIVGDPAYARFYSLLNLLGLKPEPVVLKEREGFRMNPDRVREKITKRTRLVIMNSPHNPTGAVMTKKENEQLFRLARKYNFLILSDEVYGKLIYSGQHYSPGVNDHCRSNVVILNSFSKAYAMTGWRLGYLVGPKELMKKVEVLIRNTIFSLPVFIQKAGISALLGSDKFLKKTVVDYKKRRNILVAGLNRLPGVKCAMPDGALYVFPNIRGTGLSSREFVNFMLEKAGVALSAGTEFGREGEGFIRVSFTVSMKDIQEAVKRMEAVLQNKNFQYARKN